MTRHPRPDHFRDCPSRPTDPDRPTNPSSAADGRTRRSRVAFLQVTGLRQRREIVTRRVGDAEARRGPPLALYARAVLSPPRSPWCRGAAGGYPGGGARPGTAPGRCGKTARSFRGGGLAGLGVRQRDAQAGQRAQQLRGQERRAVVVYDTAQLADLATRLVSDASPHRNGHHITVTYGRGCPIGDPAAGAALRHFRSAA